MNEHQHPDFASRDNCEECLAAMRTAKRQIAVREDVRGAAWNYLALLDRHRKVFAQDNCPERGDFPRWYRDKAAGYGRVEAALTRLRDALATVALAESDYRSLLHRILTSREYGRMEAEGLAADALGLRWSEAQDGWVSPDDLVEKGLP